MKNPFRVLSLASLALAATLLLPASTQDHGGHGADAKPERPADAEKPAKKAWAGEPYLLPVDVVTGEDLPELEEQVVVRHEGRELRFGSEESLETFRAEPGPYLKRIDRMMIADQLPYYPLETCLVSGEELGSMGKPLDRLHKNRLMRLCCKGCIRKFEKDPDSFVPRLDQAAREAQLKDYPVMTCAVSGEELGSMGKPLECMVGGRLVRLCCKSCTRKLAADPARYVAKVDAARAAAREEAERREEARGEGAGR